MLVRHKLLKDRLVAALTDRCTFPSDSGLRRSSGHKGPARFPRNARFRGLHAASCKWKQAMGAPDESSCPTCPAVPELHSQTYKRKSTESHSGSSRSATALNGHSRIIANSP